MNDSIILINYVVVAIYGGILSASFCGVFKSSKNRFAILGTVVAILFFHVLIFSIGNFLFFKRIYPLIMHAPLAIVLCIITKKKLWSFIAVFTAYLCCQLRRWIALLITTVISGDDVTLAIMELIVTLPILWIIVRYVSPSVRSISKRPVSIQFQFGLIPFLYYIYDYFTFVYTELPLRSMPVAVEFMSFVCCSIYLLFIIRISANEQEKLIMEQTKNSLDIQMTQSLREITALQKSQKEAATYRHDLRHHLQYLSSCISENKLEQAQFYIHDVCNEFETQKIKRYCENEEVNLIFSAFANRMKKMNAKVSMEVVLPLILSIPTVDLCVLISNLLENAMHACQDVVNEGENAVLKVQSYEKNGKFYLQVQNTFQQPINFENGVPVTDRPGHGLGIRSICSIIDKYNGIYSFLLEEELFTVRIMI